MMPWVYRHVGPPSGIMFCHRFDAPHHAGFWEGAEWCEKQIGRLVPQNKGLWTVNAPAVIWLLRDDDAFAFRMRWC